MMNMIYICVEQMDVTIHKRPIFNNDLAKPP